MTLDEGRMRTCRFPRFSALQMLLRQSDCEVRQYVSIQRSVPVNSLL